MFGRACYALLVLALGLSGLLPAFPPQSVPLAQAGPTADRPFGFDQSAPGASAPILQAGRTEEPAPPPKGPIPAAIPPTGVDVRVNAVDQPVELTVQSETSAAVNRNNGTICVTFNDTADWPAEGLAGFSRSTDGGQTWQDGGVVPPSAGGTSWGDPSVAWRRLDGYFYYTALLMVGSDLYVGLWRSVDDCASFQWVGIVHTSTFDDKEFMTIDNYPASPYYGRLYVAWTDIGIDHRIRLSYSDDGTTWIGPVVLSTPDCQGAWPAVAPNGDVYVAWMRADNYPYGPIDAEVVRSTNGGNSFFYVADPLSNAIAPYDAQATANCSRPALKANPGDGIRYYAMPQIVVGPDGCLHVVYSYDPDGYNVGDVINVYYRRSCTNGSSWEPEVRLNDDDTLTDQFFPAITVNAYNIVAASWYDRRLDPSNNYLFDRYWTLSYDGGTTWEPNARVSDVSSSVYTYNCYHGDYDQMASDDDHVYLVWSDDRIWFNGHWDPDIWFDQALITPDFSLAVDPAWHEVCRGDVVTSTITIGSVKGYDQPVTLGDSGLPAGVQTAFTVNPVTPPGSSTYVITVTESALAGSYDWPVSGSSPTLTHHVTVTLVISDCCDPVQGAGFVWTPLTPTVGQVVTFTASASGTEPITFSWDFELQISKFELNNPITHVFTMTGEYRVTLTATNDCGEAVVAHTVTVVPACEPVSRADFGWVPFEPLPDELVTFTAWASGTAPISYSWDLGDGNTASGPVVTHAYTDGGVYTVTMTASNACGGESVAHTVTVPLPCCQPVEILLVAADVAGCVVAFSAEVTGTAPFSYSWDLGALGVFTVPSPTVDFGTPGTYPYTLTVVNLGGAASDTVTGTVTVDCSQEWRVYLPLLFKDSGG